MGEIAEMMLDGEMCQECGEYLGGGGGFPRTCAGCRGRSHAAPETSDKVPCPYCNRKVKASGLEQHKRDVHSGKPAELQKGQALGRCRGCGVPILWIKLPNGRGMPCNPDVVSSANLSKGSKIVTANGHVFTVKEQREGFETFGYVPHWATCPNAGEFRKKK